MFLNLELAIFANVQLASWASLKLEISNSYEIVSEWVNDLKGSKKRFDKHDGKCGFSALFNIKCIFRSKFSSLCPGYLFLIHHNHFQKCACRCFLKASFSACYFLIFFSSKIYNLTNLDFSSNTLFFNFTAHLNFLVYLALSNKVSPFWHTISRFSNFLKLTIIISFTFLQFH